MVKAISVLCMCLLSITNQAIQNYKLIKALIQIKITHNTKTLKTRYKLNKTYNTNITNKQKIKRYIRNIKRCSYLSSTPNKTLNHKHINTITHKSLI